MAHRALTDSASSWRARLSAVEELALESPMPIAALHATLGLCTNQPAPLTAAATRCVQHGLSDDVDLMHEVCAYNYAGERLTLGQLLARYGAGGVDTEYEYEAANWQAAWAAERAQRGVGVTGTYVFNALSCEECPSGYYAPTAQVDACLACGAGDRTEAVSKATTCSSCDAGTYSEGLVAVNCSTCEAGKASSTRASECYDCEGGESAVVTLSSLRTGRHV